MPPARTVLHFRRVKFGLLGRGDALSHCSCCRQAFLNISAAQKVIEAKTWLLSLFSLVPVHERAVRKTTRAIRLKSAAPPTQTEPPNCEMLHSYRPFRSFCACYTKAYEQSSIKLKMVAFARALQNSQKEASEHFGKLSPVRP